MGEPASGIEIQTFVAAGLTPEKAMLSCRYEAIPNDRTRELPASLRPVWSSAQEVSMRTPFVPPLVALVISSSACVSDTQSAAQWDGSVRDSAGIEIVENFGEPLWRPGEEWRLVEDLRIGMRDGPPEYQFGRVTGFVPLSDGRIVVADGMASKIRFYSATGEHLYSIGEQGAGPREIGQGWIQTLRGYGDTLLIGDSRNLQVHRIAPDGTWLSSFSTRPEGGWMLDGWDTSPSGLIASVFTPLQLPDEPLADTMDVIIIRHLDGTLGDTIGRVPMARSFRFAGDSPELYYYAPTPDFDLRWEGGLITGRTDRYELTWRRPDGEPVRIVRLNRDREPFTASEQATLMKRLEEILKQGDRTPERVQQIKNAIHFEDMYPYYRRFMCGPEGTLWLRRIRPISDMSPEEKEALNFNRRPRPGTGFDVFDDQGRYLGVVEAPLEMPLGLLFGDRMFGIMKDEFDVEYVQTWHIEGLDQTASAG
jgi:hypothetical protein